MKIDKIKSNNYFKFYDNNLLNSMYSLIIQSADQKQIFWCDLIPEQSIKHLDDTLGYHIYDDKIYVEIRIDYDDTFNNYFILYSFLTSLRGIATYYSHEVNFYNLKINKKNICSHYDLKEFKDKNFIEIELFYKDSVISDLSKNQWSFKDIYQCYNPCWE